MRHFIYLFALLAMLSACENNEKKEEAKSSGNEVETFKDSLRYPQEKHLKNVQQLTFGGDNAEAYFSFDNKRLVFQRTTRDSVVPCDQIFTGVIPPLGEPFDYHMVSTGLGRTTCAYFYPDNDTIIYASTSFFDEACPPEPDLRKLKKYVWPIYNSYELVLTDREGSFQYRLTNNNYYDAEATISPKGDKMIFTSTRSGDLDLWVMNLDGTGLKQITHELGYDGGAFFSPDGSKIVWRASRPKGEDAEQYKKLLAEGLIQPTHLELFIADADGSNVKQVTSLGSANWAPNWHPSGKKIIFASNHKSGGRTFNLFLVNTDGSGLEQITFDNTFDAFPMFSFDGKKLVWCSNRNNGGNHDTNVFVADWEE